MQTAPVIYKDFWFKIIGSLLASAIIDAINRDEPFTERLSSTYFYTDLLGGFVIALTLWEIVRFCTRFLDRKFNWMEQPVRRLLSQFVLGVLFPALLSFAFTSVFMKLAYQQDIFQTSWLYNEFYTVVLIIVLINLVYFTWWLYLTRKQPSSSTLISNNQTNEEYLASRFQNNTIEVTRAGKTILLRHTEIAYSHLSNGYCYIRPFEGDVFVTNYTLDEVSRLLGEALFFRVNRQFLVSRKSCTAYKSIENGKIELDLIPPFKTPVIVSQKRARDFRKWVSAAIAEL